MKRILIGAIALLTIGCFALGHDTVAVSRAPVVTVSEAVSPRTWIVHVCFGVAFVAIVLGLYVGNVFRRKV